MNSIVSISSIPFIYRLDKDGKNSPKDRARGRTRAFILVRFNFSTDGHQRDRCAPMPTAPTRTLGGPRDGGHDDHWAGREPGRGSSGGLETDRHLERGQ